ncbi:MAG: PAS domain S-box protein [Planctomycetes bacterium]|nr:PAS domain S-box protein [Planctomycetota bacterium]
MLWALAALLAIALATLIVNLMVLRGLSRRRRNSPRLGKSVREAEPVDSNAPRPTLVISRGGECLRDPGNPDAESWFEHAPADVQSVITKRVADALRDGCVKHVVVSLGAKTRAVTITPPTGEAERPDAARVEICDADSQLTAASDADDLAARNAAILSSSMDGMFVVAEDCRILDVNAAFCRMVGYSNEELLELRISDLEIAPAAGTTRLGSPEIARTGHHLFTAAYRHKDGDPIELEISVTSLRNGCGKLLVGFARDITERNRAEEKLRQAHERLRFHVDRMPLGYIVWSPDLRVQEWNAAAEKLLGYTSDEAVGRSADELIVADESRLQTARMWSALLGGDQNGHELLVNRRKSGDLIKCEWFSTVLHDGAGRIQCIATMLRDVSERERLEIQLREAQKLKSLGVLAGGVAHDFNNFLVSILCNASLALEKLDADSDARGHVRKIVNASRRASDLTRQMLAYSGRATYDVQPMDLNALVSEMADFMRAAMTKSVTLHIQLPDGLPAIEADSGQIQQVVMNLLLNAAEATDTSGGEVTVSTSLETIDARQIAIAYADQNIGPGEYVCLRVSDSGCGMSPETLGRIFDPFFTTKFTGRGLGLAAILGNVRAHRGAIRVDSREGEGTVFTVVFPASHRSPEPPADASSAALSRSAASLRAGRTVLVIDDEEDIREVVDSILSGRGMKVLTAENGVRGIELFSRHADEIDLVLLDMMMPGMSGAEVMHEILQIRPDAKIVLSSGFAEKEALDRLSESRPAAFVQKPYSVEGLLSTIGAALE